MKRREFVTAISGSDFMANRSGEIAGTSAVASGASPKISVVLPNYNHGHWLGRAVWALATQAVSSMEILLIDDGSTDGSAAIIKELCEKYDCVRLIQHETNRGAHQAVRSGIAVARGDFILFAAADDIVLPELLSRGEAALNAYPQAAFFCSEVALLNRAGHLLDYRPVVPPRFSSGYVSPAETRRAIRFGDNWFVGSSVMYRRTMLAEAGYFDEALGTLCDGIVMRRLAFECGFYFERKVLAVWVVDPATLSSQTSLSPSESSRILSAGLGCIADRFPADVRASYGELFRRRFTFNIARQQLLWLTGDSVPEVICKTVGCGLFGRALIHLTYRTPQIGRGLTLAFLAIRLRPVSFVALVRSFLRVRLIERTERGAVRKLAEKAFAKESC